MARPDPPASASASEATHFGFSTVPLGEKQERVDEVFHKVARRYDLMNDLMSGGLHRHWKDRLAGRVRPSRSRPFHHIDVAGGTADVALRVAALGGPQTEVTVVDINADMLAVGRDRAARRKEGGRLRFVEGNAEDLPFPDRHFDAYSIAFGIRNVPRIELALAEAHRVLKIGGHFLCLEFSSVELPLLQRAYDAYSFAAIPALGKVVTGDGAPYRYLVESIRKFADAEAFRERIAEAGFRRTGFERFAGGIVAIHCGWKL